MPLKWCAVCRTVMWPLRSARFEGSNCTLCSGRRRAARGSWGRGGGAGAGGGARPPARGGGARGRGRGAVECCEGKPADPKTLGQQIEKLQKRFALKRVVLVGDRGLITSARIREELKPSGSIDWITALRAPAIRQLVREGSLQPSLFDEKNLAEIVDPAYPGERLVVCRNPLLAEE